MQIGERFTYSYFEGGYRAEDVKKALKLLCNAGIIKRVSLTAGNGLPLGAEVNDKFRKYIYIAGTVFPWEKNRNRLLTNAVVYKKEVCYYFWNSR